MRLAALGYGACNWLTILAISSYILTQFVEQSRSDEYSLTEAEPAATCGRRPAWRPESRIDNPDQTEAPKPKPRPRPRPRPWWMWFFGLKSAEIDSTREEADYDKVDNRNFDDFDEDSEEEGDNDVDEDGHEEGDYEPSEELIAQMAKTIGKFTIWPGGKPDGSNETDPLSKSAHVAGGRLAEPGRFPSYVMLTEWQDWHGILCGGTLIGRKLVITAGHCIAQKSGRLNVIVGLNSPGKSQVKVHEVGEICISPGYCISPNSNLPLRDVALLKLKEPVRYTKYIQPACVQLDNPGDGIYEAAGMGHVEGQSFPHELMWTRLERGCSFWLWAGQTDMRPTVECYRGVRGTRICSGDSGGPVYYYVNKGKSLRQVVAGAASFSQEGCMVSPMMPISFYAHFSGIPKHVTNLQNECATNFDPQGERYC